MTSKYLTFIVSNFFAVFGLITACSLTPTPMPTPTPTVSRDRAIEIAITGCKMGHLQLVGKPQNIHTKLITLEEADKQTRVEGETTYYGISMDTRVWLVQMDGQLQLIGGPLPINPKDGRLVTPTPSQPFWGTCIAIVNANTGDVIGIRG